MRKQALRASEALSVGASMADLDELEITTVLGCPVDCNYCPQSQLRQTKGNRKNRLELGDFRKALGNLDIDCRISWTGYSEPCLSQDLPEMMISAMDNRRDQVISTTLNGNKDSIDWIIRNPICKLFVLHLPDGQNNMKGLKIDSSYINNLKLAIESYLKSGNIGRIRIMVFGNKLRAEVSDIVKYYYQKGLLTPRNFKISTEPSSRVDGVQHVQGMKLVKDSLGNYNKVSSMGYLCTKRKLNQPVLLPDGSLNICSFDYGFRGIYGNLFKDKYSKIRKEWIHHIKSTYSLGSLNPCTKCEHYVPYEYLSKYTKYQEKDSPYVAWFDTKLTLEESILRAINIS